MPLPEPELELLREMLEEDPGAEVFLQVGRELTGRGNHGEAIDVLLAGIDARDEAPEEGWRLLAEASLRAGQYLRAVNALRRVDTDPETDAQMARLRVLVLEAIGRDEQAREAAEGFLEVHPGDVVVTTALERMTAPPPDPGRRLADPLVSVKRAEQYAALGRARRALRIYRRLHYHHPDELGLEHRVRELQGQPALPPDDLSDELTGERVTGAPPGLTMPAPALQGATDEGDTLESEPFTPDAEKTDPAIDFDIEAIRAEIAERKRAAVEAKGDGGEPTEDEAASDEAESDEAGPSRRSLLR